MDILIVDDDLLFQELISHSIAKIGHNHHLAVDGSDALEKLQGGLNVDLVISDWVMPGLSGVDLCTRIRQEADKKNIFFLFLTAKESREDYLLAMKAGADDFLAKPFDPEILAAKVRAIERKFDLQKQLLIANDQLENSNRKLDTAIRKMEKDISAAAKLQMGLLPPDQTVFGNFKIASALLPSSSVSGDIYNYFKPENGNLSLYSIDVAGHGPRAAMMSFTISKFIIDRWTGGNTSNFGDPSQFMTELNQKFQSSPPDNDYFTMLFALISDEGRMRMCQAGHPNPIATPIDGGKPFHLGAGGFPVGLVDSVPYEDISIDISQVHRVVFYTDGIPECENSNNEMYGVERLRDLIHKSENLPLEEVIPAITHKLKEWRGRAEFEDDISVIVLENRRGCRSKHDKA